MHAGLREHKKQLQREQLLTAALRLFAHKGYDETTIADITTAAGCAQRTFFLYFRSKEEILPALLQQSVDDLASALLSRPSDKTTLDSFEHWMLGQLARHASAQDFRPHASLVQKQIQLLGILLKPVLTKAYASDLGLQPSAPQAKLLANAAVLALAALDLDQTTHTQRVRYVRQVITFLRAGMSAIASN